MSTEVSIRTRSAVLAGDLEIPAGAHGIVLFAHGRGDGRFDPCQHDIAAVIREAGFGTLLFDLLTREEDLIDLSTCRLRFNIALLARRLVGATDWLLLQPRSVGLPVGYFGSSTGGAAALVAAAERPGAVGAVVCHRGRPDLAGDALDAVRTPTLLVLDGSDDPFYAFNLGAMDQIAAPISLVILRGTKHLFKLPGKLEEVAQRAAAWFRTYLEPAPAMAGTARPSSGRMVFASTKR